MTSLDQPAAPPAEPLGLLRRWLGEVAGSPGRTPAGHGGFVLVPAAIEFWQGDPDRIHRRWHYQRDGEGWSHWLLQP